MKNVEDLYPLSPMQLGMLFHSLYEPGSGYYVEQLSCVVGRGLNVAAFERAWQQLIERHPILRTAFVWEGLDEPLQVVRRNVGLSLAEQDWRAHTPEEQRLRLEAFLEADRVRGFDLADAPLMRFYLFRLDEEAYQFVWSSHHLLMDGWSMFLLLKELFALYGALSASTPLQLERSRPFRDYIAWLQQQDMPKAEAYWRRSLKGFTVPTPLGIGRASGQASAEEHQYGKQQVLLSEKLTDSLQSFARQHRLTLGTLMQGAWALLLACYSGEDDVLFGVTVSGRPAELAGVETMVGLFINTLPMRVRVDAHAPLLDWLGQVQERQIELRQYEFSPLVEIQGWSDVERGQPLFETILGFENYPVDQAVWEMSGGMDIRDVSLAEKTNFPINIAILPGARLTLDIMYDCDRFDAAALTRLTGHFRSLLESMVERPEQLLGELPLLTGEERQIMLTEWNATGMDYPAHSCLHELFEAQAARTPDAPALAFEDERLTYAELNAQANRLAHKLRAMGVGPEAAVGLLMERSLKMVVGLLAVLKAGGSYVPIDPTYPRERLAFIFDDAQFGVLLTQKHLVEGLPEHGARVVCLDDAWTPAPENEQNPPNLTTPDNLAYIIYTSGSTGRPKGVLISHRAVVNHNHAIVPLYELSADDRVLQFASMSFDVAVEEIFPTWLSGGCVVVRPDSALSSHQAFFDLLREERISVVNLSTPYWNELMAELSRTGSSIADSLRLAAIGGEKGLPEGFAFAQQQAGAGVRIMNVYGPTETTVTNTVYDMTACGVPPAVDSVPIGRPIANTDIYILDRNLRPVPVGVGGEIHIGGESIARGYLNRAGQTAEKFIPHPFTTEPGARLYRTGDHARYLAGGDIEFLGRVDQQVKIRGFRIEPGEIEAVLSRAHGVREAVVVAREDVPGDKRLVAYLVADGESATTTGEWRDYVGEHLPEHMIPSAFVLLDEFPLTANGKLDRKALPAPELSASATGDASVGPRTPVEEILSGLWGEVLGVGAVGVDEDFFDLGGHSLLATQLVSRVREAFGVEVALRQVFESPTVAGLAEKIQALISAGHGLEAPPIVALERGERVPLSFAQQRLWFIDQLEPGQAYYNMPAAVRLNGELNEEALERTLNEVVRRHEVLRTRYAEAEGQPVQVIAAAAGLRLDVRDLGALPAAERQEEVERLTREEAARSFNLNSDMLLRVSLLRLSDVEHVLLFTMHHIVSDGWSMGVLVREVAALYEAFSRGEASPLPELAVQYADFAVWQREWLSGEVLEAQLAYWRERLAGAPAMLELPTDRPRPSVHTFNGARVEFSLTPELSEGLKALSRRQGATLFMTLLAAFQLLLSRYSGQDDVVVGADVANRNRGETEGLIGFFVNMLVLRTDLSGGPTFAGLLRRVREVTLGAYAHQDLPFEKLVEELQPGRDMSHSPLFQVFFVLQNTPMGTLELPGLTLDMFETDNATSKFDLLLGMQETEQGIKAEFEFNTDLFDASTIRRMSRHLEELLKSVVAAPDAPLRQLSLLPPSELQQLASFSSSPSAPLPRPLAVHRLFERQAALSPDAVALTARDCQLTYRQLNERANRLAHYLRSSGVAADMPVGLCMERSAEMVVALLAILKAGGAYVPLDPSYPLDRLAWMMEDAGLSVLVTEEGAEERLPSHWAQAVVVDREQDEIGRHSKENFGEAGGEQGDEATGDELAYVMYTSGSTGRPKGVSVTHRGVVRLVRETNYASFGPGEVFLQLAPMSFDASTFEVWGALLNGGRLVVMGAGAPTLEEIGGVIRGEGVTTVWLTAGLFHLMVQERAGDLVGVRQLLAGGDVLGVGAVEKYLRNAGAGAHLINGYGPTEGTTFTCCHVMTNETTIVNSVPIGRPIAHTQVYLLDKNIQPVPVGIPGELYIGGDGLGRGYHNRPDLTAERFVPNPFDAGKRLYRTGDIARYTEDGTIEFLGRRDQQVKIRGFRIEPGEIEAVLSQSPGVREAVVIAREDVPGDKRLVAYLVADGESAMTPGEWRDYVGARLPEYMVPSAFVLLDEIPLTLNGKLDRRALPAPELSGQAGGRPSQEPRTPVEEILSGLWGEVLGVGAVGVDEDFFDLGGHSLLATQLVSRVREAFGVEVALRQVFESPTVAGLARHVEAELKNERGVAVPPIVALERGERVPLSFAQQRLWFLEQLEPGSPFYNMPFAFRLSGELNEEALERTLNEVVRRHEILRTRYAEAEGQPVQVIAAAAGLRLDVRDLGALPAAEREVEARWLASEEARKPFDLRVEPLRACLLRLSEDEHVLLVTMHHIVTDGWSLGVLGKEVAALYEAYTQGEPSPLAELPIQYGDFALWQRDWLQGEVLDTQLSYWRERLAGAPAVLELPTDRPRPAMQTFDGAYETFELSAELSTRLRALSRQQGVTLFMTLLTGFQLLLSRYSGQEDIVTGTPIANRHQGETEDLIGFFVNTLVMRNNLGGNPTFRELLGRTRETALGAYAHQDLPFEKLVEELQPERSLSHGPLFQVMFALQNAPMGELQLPGLILSRIEDDDAPVKFDLSLDMQEAGGRITGAFAYNLDLFDQATVRRMITHFERLLEGAAADAGRRLSELSMLTEAERSTLAQWNETRADYPREEGLHGLFEKQAGQTPEAIAVVFEDERVSYRELNRRANQLAHHLVQSGLKPETTVGLYIERTVEAVVGVLAILKAGGTYLPLDTQQPAERLAFILEDARVTMLITQQSLLASLPTHQAQIICLDADAGVIGAQRESALAGPINPAGVAYLIYTSGTTGRPKAVAVEHRNVVNIISAAARRFDFAEGDVLPVIASLAFDISLFELMTPLASGACALMCGREHVLDMSELSASLEQCTLVHMVPSLMRQFIETINEDGTAHRYQGLRRIFIGGDVVPPELLKLMSETLPAARIEVLYGPTEAALFCTSEAIRPEQIEPRYVIGRPLDNVVVEIYDADRNQVPVGVPGELYIGGECVTRGYLNQDELTAEKYVVMNGRRYYRSGDRGRFLPDGRIEFMGRIDFQVKVRGFRVELGEIENTLGMHEEVAQAVVVAQTDPAGEKRLVAYVLPRQSAGAAPAKADSNELADVQLWPSIGEYPVYDELIYHGLTSDEPRNLIYKEALERLARGKVVVDIGTGGEAILARLSVEAGARHVYALEILETSYQQARRRLEELGLTEKITLIRGDATEVELPELCDVCVTETFEAIAGAEGVAAIINGARRLLKPDGVVIPPRSLTKIAAVRLPEEVHADPHFTQVSAHYVRKIFDAVGHEFDLRLCIKDFPASNLISDAALFEDLDFSGYANQQYSHPVSMTINRESRLDGFLLWLRLEFGEGSSLDILEGKYSWFPVYFPAFHPGLDVRAGDRIDAVCSASISDDRIHPDYKLVGHVRRQDGEDVEFTFESSHHGQQYRANAFYEQLFGAAQIAGRASRRGSLQVAEVREYLQQRLPEYMVPSAFVVLDEMPLMPNGKVDRRALPLPDTDEAEQTAPAAGLTAVEEILAGIWTELLHITNVHAGSNFFELGGHSLLAMRLMARVRKNLRVDLPLRLFFAEPTLAALARSVESAFAIGEHDASPIARVPRDGALPLSFAQQRLWFIDQLEPNTPKYNMPLAVRLAGGLNVRALEQTLNEVVRRHESLRTSFPEVGGEPRQFIAPALHLALDVRDLSALPEAERQAELARLVAEAAALPFDLAAGALWRARLLRLGETEHVLLFVMHHIVSDGWSMGVLLDEVATLYEAFVQEQPSPLAELPIQYADFAHWQRQYLAGEALASHLAYWRTQLGGRLPILELPADRPRPAVQSFRGSHEEFELGEELSNKLKALSRREGVTLFMTLLAAFEVLLARYSGQADIVVGTPIANRNRTEIEPLIGFFVNTLVMRNQIRGEARFRELLGEVRDVCLGAYAHQDVPFERLVEELQPERSLSHTPLFQVMFVLQNAPAEARNLPGVSINTLELDTFTSKFDLLLNMQEEGRKITGSMEYSQDLFDASTVRRMISHLTTLLEGIAADPGQLVHRLPLLSGEESARLLSPPDGTSFTYPSQTCIHQQFEAQVRRTPQAVALTYEDQHLTYAELNRRANQLAHRLRSSGVGPEMLVGLLMERSTEMIVSLLAVLKAGGAYLPLDPTYPQERLAFMLEDGQVELVLTEQRLTENLPARHGAKVICVDAERDSLAGEPESDIDSGATSENLAYVIYTSGSTGRPKGVMVKHANVARLMSATQPWYGFDEQDVWTFFHSYTFDFSVWELWGALLYGGRLVMVPYLVSRSPDAFYELLSAEQVTVLNQTPSAFRQLIEVEQVKKDVPPLALRLVIFGGEALELQSLKPWFERHGDTRPQLVNMYGITETTVHVTYRPLTADDLGRTTGSVIGGAIPDLQVYVLDQHQQLTPVGVPGEMYVGGAGVARAYLNRPELTATRFIPDPFNSAPGARLYRSGDLVRRLPDGDIEYRGRIDEQVKVRGFRIEPEEIRAQLGRHPAVREALVLVTEGDADDRRLVAYVVPGEPRTLLAGELRGYLQQHLPDYMIPSAFVLMEALPLTPNGKVDRRALPLPEQLGTAFNNHHDSPMTAVEEVLAGIWSEIIDVRHLGVHDNFFDAGGHSLLATQIISRVRLAFRIDLPVRTIYESPTIAEMAAIIESKLKAGQGLAAPPIVRVGRDRPLPLSFAQQRLWFISQLEPDSASYNSPLAVRLTGALDVAALARTVNEIMRRHEVLRTHFEVSGGTPVQVVEGQWDAGLEVADLSGLGEREREAEAARAAAGEAGAPFDLSTGPVLRARLLRMGEREHVFLLTMHHIVSDGWSMGVLIREVGALYGAYARGEGSPLAELEIQYGDFAVWQREWLRGEVLEKQLSYWRQQLKGTLPVLKLPTDRPRPPVPTFNGRRETFRLPAHLGAALQTLSRLHNTTLFMTMLAAFQILLSRHSGQEDILIGSAIANRNRGETEDLIGFFVNMLVMRGNLSGDPTFQDLLKQVRETALGAYAHQDVPFEKLVGEFVQERQLNHAPLVQVAFGLHNAPMRTLELPGLTLQLLDFEEDAGRFDLTLWMNDEAGELSGTWYYNTDLFDAETIKRFHGHFETLLTNVVAQPGARISTLEMFTDEERREHEGRRKESDESRVRKLRATMRRAVGETALEPPPETTLLEEV